MIAVRKMSLHRNCSAATRRISTPSALASIITVCSYTPVPTTVKVYVSAPVDEASATIGRLSVCVTDIARWLSTSRLRLNMEKPDLIFLDSRHKWRRSSNMKFLFCRRPLQPWTQRGTSVSFWTIISRYRMSALCRSAYYFLCQLRQVVRSMLADAAMTVVHAFISSHLDYCNCLLCSSAYRPYRIIIIIIRTFVTRAVSANILNLRRRQSLGEEDGGSEV